MRVHHYFLYIKPDGKVLGCWHDFDEENVMGDLNRESVRDIWYGRRFKSSVNLSTGATGACLRSVKGRGQRMT